MIKQLIQKFSRKTEVFPEKDLKKSFKTEAFKEEEFISSKFLETVLKDLERFPPHEWVIWMSMASINWYSHGCLNYKLMLLKDIGYEHNKIYWHGKMKPTYNTVDVDMVESHKNQLYHAFFPLYVNGIKEKETAKILAAQISFLDNDKRILCKDTNNE